MTVKRGLKGVTRGALPGPRKEPGFTGSFCLGAPGAGKGTQAELLCERLGACHLSTGDLFRAAKGFSTGELNLELKKALEHMRCGELVPDETVLALVRQRNRCLRCSNGFVLDGFPRTVEQASALEETLEEQGLGLTGAIHYSLPLVKIIARLSGRRACPMCKAVFHLKERPPKVAGLCDHCGFQLYQREDDRPESIHVRMRAYEQSTAPLLDFYQKRGLLLAINAGGPAVEICQNTLTALAAPSMASALA